MVNLSDNEDLDVSLDDIEFVYVDSINIEHVENKLVYDLEVDEIPNYNTQVGVVHNGGGKRKGSFAIYLETYHADIMDFLDLRKNNGKEELRTRDLNLAIWTPDLFFQRVEADEDWTLMDPNKCPNLSETYGEEFNKLYESYEAKEMGERTIKARDVWNKILESCIETGEPYILAKDACNIKSNQKNLGTIKSSNLCAEIIQYSDHENTSICNLSSISLPSCVTNNKFDFNKLELTTKTLVENLNKVIDVEYYPTDKAKKTNLRDRPIGIGIQGLSTLFAMLRYSWESEEAKNLNRDIAETMYYAAMKTSCELAKESKPYKTFKGSPLSQGLFQFDLWNIKPSNRYDWETLREDVKKFGVRNSLLIALMPTASTSQIMGNTECFEPFTSNIYKRSTLSGEFIQINKFLVDDLIKLDLWNEEMRQTIIAHNGSIQSIPNIPNDIKALYKTVWEISQRILIDFAADRGPFVCQSQSMNLFFKDANKAKLTSAFFYAWKKGLKTIVYYTRTTGAKETTKFTVPKDIEDKAKLQEEAADGVSCSLDSPEDCLACGS